ncbi:hypothetical protein [Kitasatospora sp. NPDC093558]|uniref:hypothetical protein n=1 Tax=Kitasatospora sp. NPDC093558 TaxID=3155201 RepID=UPI003448DA52
MSDDPVNPGEVPVFTGDLFALDNRVQSISTAGAAIASAAGAVHTSFGGLSAFYKAPEAEQLFATTKPVDDLGTKLSQDACIVAGALGTYSKDAAPLVKRLADLKREAESFHSKVANDHDWRQDDGKVEFMDPHGNVYDEAGNLRQHGDEAPKDGANPNPAKPKPPAPAHARTPELVGVGGRNGAIKLASDISDPLHAPDHAPPAGHAPDHTPGGHAPEGPRNDANAPHGGRDLPAPGGRFEPPATGGHDGSHGAGGEGSSTAGHDGSGANGHPQSTSTGTHGPDTPGGGTHQGEQRISPERAKELMDEHVRLANDDPAWLEKHYHTKHEPPRRKSIGALVDGVELPQLTRDANGKLISIHDLPNGPREGRYDRTPLGLDSVPEGNLSKLQKLAGDRRVSLELTKALQDLDKANTPANRQTVESAREAFDKRLFGVANNTKISEKLGSAASALHAIPHEFRDAVPIELPETGNGANMFDRAYKLPDGERLIVEEKAPSSDPDWRQGKADPDLDYPHDDGGAQGLRVQQGTRPYLRTLFREMELRGGEDARIAKDLRDALMAGKLKYVLVTAKVDANGDYLGAVMEHFKDIHPEEGR